MSYKFFNRFTLAFFLLMQLPIFGNFSGFSISIGGGAEKNMSKVKSDYNYTNFYGGAFDAGTIGTKKFSPQKNVGIFSNLSAEYGLNYCKNWHASVFSSIDFAPNNLKMKNATPYYFANPNHRDDDPGNYIVTCKIKSHPSYSLGIKLGYYFSDNLMTFVGISYHTMKSIISIQNTTSIPPAVVPPNLKVRDKKSFNGIGLSVGCKYALAKSWFVGFTTQYVQFNTQSVAFPTYKDPSEMTIAQTIKVFPSSLRAFASIGYQF